jgi:hypothetical protein
MQELWSDNSWPLLSSHVNNRRGMVFSAQSILMVAYATIEYIMPSISNDSSAREDMVFSTSSVPRYYNKYKI